MQFTAIKNFMGRVPYELIRYSDSATKEKLDHCGVFIPLPSDLAKKFPSKKQDDSTPHITLFYIGDLDPERVDDVEAALSEALQWVKPFTVCMEDYGEFVNDDGLTIAHMKPRVRGSHLSFQDIHSTIREALDRAEVGYKHRPGPFKPHVTLAYMKEGKVYKGAKPTGSFDVDNLELWLGDKIIKFPLRERSSSRRSMNYADKGSKEGRWVTIGASPVEVNGKTKKEGGTPVFITSDGRITKGPSGLTGKKIGELGKVGKGAKEGEPKGKEGVKEKDKGVSRKGPGSRDFKEKDIREILNSESSTLGVHRYFSDWGKASGRGKFGRARKGRLGGGMSTEIPESKWKESPFNDLPAKERSEINETLDRFEKVVYSKARVYGLNHDQSMSVAVNFQSPKDAAEALNDPEVTKDTSPTSIDVSKYKGKGKDETKPTANNARDQVLEKEQKRLEKATQDWLWKAHMAAAPSTMGTPPMGQLSAVRKERAEIAGDAPWQKSKEDRPRKMTERQHEKALLNAAVQGKPVSPEIISQYPGLKEKIKEGIKSAKERASLKIPRGKAKTAMLEDLKGRLKRPRGRLMSRVERDSIQGGIEDIQDLKRNRTPLGKMDAGEWHDTVSRLNVIIKQLDTKKYNESPTIHYAEDKEPKKDARWVTMNGARVLIENGKPTKGPASIVNGSKGNSKEAAAPRSELEKAKDAGHWIEAMSRSGDKANFKIGGQSISVDRNDASGKERTLGDTREEAFKVFNEIQAKWGMGSKSNSFELTKDDGGFAPLGKAVPQNKSGFQLTENDGGFAPLGTALPSNKSGFQLEPDQAAASKQFALMGNAVNKPQEPAQDTAPASAPKTDHVSEFQSKALDMIKEWGLNKIGFDAKSVAASPAKQLAQSGFMAARQWHANRPAPQPKAPQSSQGGWVGGILDTFRAEFSQSMGDLKTSHFFGDRPALTYASEKEGRWVTIGAQAVTVNGKTKKEGGTPVFISSDGRITKGPGALTGKRVGSLVKSKPPSKPRDKGGQHRTPPPRESKTKPPQRKPKSMGGLHSSPKPIIKDRGGLHKPPKPTEPKRNPPKEGFKPKPSAKGGLHKAPHTPVKKLQNEHFDFFRKALENAGKKNQPSMSVADFKANITQQLAEFRKPSPAPSPAADTNDKTQREFRKRDEDLGSMVGSNVGVFAKFRKIREQRQRRA